VASSLEEARKMLRSFEHFARKTATEEYLDEILKVLPKDIKAQ
jgi:hypothetical protein